MMKNYVTGLQHIGIPTNDLKKRLYFTENPPCDMEIKSWVNEMGRGWYYNKYNKNNN